MYASSVKLPRREMESLSYASRRSNSWEPFVPPPPFELKGFEKVAKLGSGSEGQVFLMREIETDQAYAVKVFDDPEDAAHEIAALEALGPHPHIIQLRQHGSVGHAAYIMMELHWGDLFEWTENLYSETGQRERDHWKADGHLVLLETEKMLLHMVRDISSALDHMQNRGYIHRDVKPNNMGVVWLEPNRPKIILCDFGFARKITDDQDKLLTPEQRDFGSETTQLFAGPRGINMEDQYYVDDAASLVMSCLHRHLFSNMDKMFNFDNPGVGKARASFFSSPELYMQYAPPRYRIKFYPWLLHYVKQVNIAMRHPVNKMPYRDALTDGEVKEEETAVRKRGLEEDTSVPRELRDSAPKQVARPSTILSRSQSPIILTLTPPSSIKTSR